MKDVFIKYVLLMGSIIIGILAFEIVLIIVGYPNPLKYDPFYKSSDIDGLVYEHKPNFSGKGRYNKTVNINSIGIRSYREFAIFPAKGVIRIAIVGDSFTFGVGVDYEKSYPYILENKLSSYGNGMTWEVMNFGVNGYSADKMINTFEAKASKFKPNIAVLAIILDDFLEARMQFSVNNGYISSPNSMFSNKMKLQSIIRKFRFATFIKMLFNKAKIIIRNKKLPDADGKSGVINEAFSEKVKNIIADYAVLCRTTETHGIVAWIDSHAGEREQYSKFLNEVVRKEGLGFVSLTNEFSKLKRKVFTLPFDSHPNVIGHEIIANKLCSYLVKLCVQKEFLTAVEQRSER